MYRQILICPESRSFQHILWRAQPEGLLIKYELRTVTYGTVSVPYLAIKVLHQMTESCSSKYLKVSQVILHNTYVDDICTGENTLEDVLALQKDLIAVFAHSGFEFKK